MKENKEKKSLASLFIHFYSNLHITDFISSISFYFFGSLYSDYLGMKIDVASLCFGLLVVLFLLIAMELLNLLFCREQELDQTLIQRFGNLDYRLIYFALAATFIVIAAVICILQVKNPTSLFVGGLMVFFIIFYTVKPFRLIYSGYGEIIYAILVTFLIPTFGFTIQSQGSLYITLTYLCIPFCVLMLADRFISENRSLSRDIDRYHTTAVMRFGSVLTLRIALYLIAFSYIFILLLGLVAIPWRFIIRWFISIPLAIYLIWNLNEVLSGEKPNWKLIEFLSKSLVFLNLMLFLFLFLLG